MRTRGSAEELERRRHLAVTRVQEGKKPAQIAEFLGVHASTIRKWWKAFQQQGAAGLAAKPHPGRQPKLTPARQSQVLNWLRKNPKSFGFATELWTAPRVAQVIERRFGVHFHPRYLNAWLTQRNISPQKPQRRPRERDDNAIRRWRSEQWPRIQNARAAWEPIWY
jgi:transposase